MTEKDIRPIPNYILKEIHKRDMKIYPWQENIVRFYAYLTVWKKELVKVTVAVSTIKGKQWACKQVAVQSTQFPFIVLFSFSGRFPHPLYTIHYIRKFL